MTQTLERVETIEHLDFEEPCTADAEPCENPATWDWVCGECGFRGPTCDPHREFMELMARDPACIQLTCVFCHKDTLETYRWERRRR